MDIEHCYDILDLEPSHINKKGLRNAYFKQALRYHPDKNSDPCANTKFQEINQSYEYLMDYHGFNDNNEDFTADKANDSNYSNTLFSFLNPLFDTDILKELQSNILISIIEKIRGKCEDKALDMFNKFSNDTFKKIYSLLYSQREVLYIPDTFFEKLIDTYRNKTSNDRIVRIFPNISDLLESNVYKLNENGSELLIPLWHHELVYDNDGGELTVLCFPKSEKGIEIDENNDIHIYRTCSLDELWRNESLEIEIGKKSLKISRDTLKMISKQTITISGIGIPRINVQDVYDISKRGNIFVTITILP